LGKRAREFASVARLRGLNPGAIAKATGPQPAFAGEGRGVKAPEVTGARPEAGRSIPGQGEVPLKRDGGPIPVVKCHSLG